MKIGVMGAGGLGGYFGGVLAEAGREVVLAGLTAVSIRRAPPRPTGR